jgi:tRNA(adenine34) deaminase
VQTGRLTGVGSKLHATRTGSPTVAYTSRPAERSATVSADVHYMQHALALARRAEAAGEVPVGAVIVVGGALAGEGWNQPIGRCDPTAHAEILALRAAGERVRSYRLADATLYVTLEPCPMCMTAIVHARVARLVFGAWDPRQGAAGSAFDLANAKSLNHRVDAFGGVLADECGALLREFFRRRRDGGSP